MLGADAGTMRWRGEPVRFRSPRQAQAAGIATVFQETLVVDELSVLDNVFLGTDGLLRWQRGRSEEEAVAREVLDRLGLAGVDLGGLARALPLERRQLVTVARALVRPWRMLILDESTSALDVRSRNALFSYLIHEQPPGAAVLFISHRMDEIARLADSVTVLGSGRTLGTLPAAEAPADLLLEMMARSRATAGATEAASAVSPATATLPPCAPVLRARGVQLRAEAPAIDLVVAAGEIVGVSGLDGHGQAAFLEMLGGLRRPAAGAVEAAAAEGGWLPLADQRRAVALGVCFVPRERKAEGLFAPLPILDNYALPTLRRWSRLAVIARRKLRRRAATDLARLHTRYAALEDPITALSGGNQQKVLLALNIAIDPSLGRPASWAPILAIATPFMLVAMAEAPAIMSGNGGLDLSVGPLAGVVNAAVVALIVPAGFDAPLALVAATLAMGLAAGALNGALVVVLRIPPIIATLGTYLIDSSLALEILLTAGSRAPDWLVGLTGAGAGVPLILAIPAAIALVWVPLRRSASGRNLLAVGGDQSAALTSGVPVGATRFLAYLVSGALAAAAGFAFTAVLGSGDPTVAPALRADRDRRRGARGRRAGRRSDLVPGPKSPESRPGLHFYMPIAYGAILLMVLALNSRGDALRRRREVRSA